MTRAVAVTIARLAIVMTAGLLVLAPALPSLRAVRPHAADGRCAGEAATRDPACVAAWAAARQRFLAPHSEGEP